MNNIDPGSSQRAHERRRRLIKARMNHPLHGEVDILVRDVSDSGIGARCSVAVALNETVTILLPDNHSAKGRIVWHKGHSFGVQLLAPIDPEAVRSAAGKPSGEGYQVPTHFRASIETRRPGFRTRSKAS